MRGAHCKQQEEKRFRTMKTLNQVIKKLPAERRGKIAARAEALGKAADDKKPPVPGTKAARGSRRLSLAHTDE